MKKPKNATKIKPFDEIKFTGESVLYDSTVEQTIPFSTLVKTASGFSEIWLAHRFKPLTDKRYIQRSAEVAAETAKSGKSEIPYEPSAKLWNDLIIEKIGYKPRDDWKTATSLEHKMSGLNGLFFAQFLDEKTDDVLESEILFDDDDNCLRFDVLFGGVPLDTWREWLTSGVMPANLSEWFDAAQYETALKLIERSIAPAVRLEVRHYLAPATGDQLNEYTLLNDNKPRKGVLATAAKVNQETKEERLIALYKQTKVRAEGYKTDAPAWHLVAAAEWHFFFNSVGVGKLSI